MQIIDYKAAIDKLNPLQIFRNNLFGKLFAIFTDKERRFFSARVSKCVFKNIELRNISVHGKINCDGVLNLQKLSDHLWKYSDSSSSSGERFLLNRIRVDNLNASICDQREDSNITGTGITLKHADISLEKVLQN